MKKSEFFACSIAFHVFLFLAALFLPPPFQSPKDDDSMTYVELKPEPKPDKLTFGYDEAAEGESPSLPPSPLPLSPQGRGENASEKSSPGGAAHGENKAQTGQAAPAPKDAPKAAPPDASKPATEQKPAPVPSPPAPPFEPVPVTRMPEPEDAPKVAVTASEEGPKAVKADKNKLNFRYQNGFPQPGMVRLRLTASGGDVDAAFTARADSPWIIVSPLSGRAPCDFKAGVDTAKLSVGFYEGRINIKSSDASIKGDQIDVTLMVLPREAGVKELPHYAWDAYMDGECKVCHMPENLMPSSDFMEKPEFCVLCHCKGGIAQDNICGAGGHPVGVAAGSGGTRMPSRGTVPSGPKSDMMRTHLPGGKVVCITCHNVMEKPGEFARAWELCSTEDRKTYYLSKGGWDSMGWYIPKVYAAQSFMKLPRRLQEIKKFRVPAGEYTWDEAEGSVTFGRPRDRGDIIYVTLTNPYLRVTTRNSAICYDCHNENTHAGLNCLACHQAHGTDNIKAVRRLVKTPSGEMRRVVFKALKGNDSFADTGAVKDGICDACHPFIPHKGKDVRGTDCTKCHSHKDGFS